MTPTFYFGCSTRPGAEFRCIERIPEWLEDGIVGIKEGITSTEIAPFGDEGKRHRPQTGAQNTAPRNSSKSNTSAWAASTAGATARIGYAMYIRSAESSMQVQVARSGNGPGLFIPKDLALRAGVREGAKVDVEAEGHRIIISPALPRCISSPIC
jgi:hypothetical protein